MPFTNLPAVLASASEGDVALGWSIPFVALLASIALMPLIHRHWWEKHYPKVAITLGLIPAIYYLALAPSAHQWLESMQDYISFIILLASLYIVSGGIAIRVNRKATPLANCTLLLIGAVLANVFGTTGAAMLLIRPYLRMNRDHIKPFHVVFFIFIVANAGGALTPIGDPPLFLGYLKGIPFWWVASHLWPLWAMAVGILVAIFFALDTWDHRKQQRTDTHDVGPQVHVVGIHNFLFIVLILVAVFREGIFHAAGELHREGFSFAGLVGIVFSREILMLAAIAGSMRLTGKMIYQANDFGLAPIREVAILFVAIFSAMAPALAYLDKHAEALPLKTPGQFYFAAGSLSSVLDNAPTYLTFLEARLSELDGKQVAQAREVVDQMGRARTRVIPPVDDPQVAAAVQELVINHPEDVENGRVKDDDLGVAFLIGIPISNAFVIAISAGAVFFGAMTYIGNGPNFMVKSIADAAGVHTPGFLRYVGLYAVPILLPVLVLVWAVFLR